MAEAGRLQAAAAMHATFAGIEAAGGSWSYAAADVRNAKAVADAVAASEKPVVGIIHGAGVLADRNIVDQTAEQFDMVYGTKVEGVENLLAACDITQLKYIGFFSSSTGRFGRTGQIAYAAGNEYLNKRAQELASQLPQCRVTSYNWGPWDGGMVNEALKQLFASEGIGVIPLDAGARYFIAEWADSAGPIEPVILGSGSSVGAQEPSNEATSDLPVIFSRPVSISSHPVLTDHVIGGKAVLPAALMIEWMVHGALHNSPGLQFIAMEEFQVHQGVKLAEQDELSLDICCAAPDMQGDTDRVVVELCSNRGRHARAVVILSMSAPGAPKQAPADASGEWKLRELYEPEHLFHGPLLQGISGIDRCGDAGLTGRANAAPAPGAWMEAPLRASWITDPLVLDVCFQLMIAWSQQERNAASLPTGFDRFEQFTTRMPTDGCEIRIQVTEASAHQATASIWLLDKAGKVCARITGYRCVIDKKLSAAFKQNQLAGAPA